jgi:alpha,alpha-trehalase
LDTDPLVYGRGLARCTVATGRCATRGAGAEARPDGTHYPGTYLAGGYNRLESRVSGRAVVNEDLVNFPNWLPVNFRPEGGRWVEWGSTELLEHRLELRLREGLLLRRYRLRDDDGRETSIAERRIVHMRHPRVAALRYTVTPENWDGPAEFRSALDASVVNDGVGRYRELASRHLEVLGTGPVEPEGVFVSTRTVQSRLEAAIAARTRFFRDGDRVEPDLEIGERDGTVGQHAVLELTRNRSVDLEKVVTFYTSRDSAISEASHDARRALLRLGDFESLRRSHRVEWDALWRRFDLELIPSRDEGGDLPRTQLILRLHIFHLLQTCSHNTVDLDVGVPARGWHGEAYRGHIFWDEIFVHPLYNLHIPEISRSLLLYRYRRLEAARAYAEEEGYRGALYPWQSGSDGTEETQVLHQNPLSGEWAPDHSRRQRHINAAIAYNVRQYAETTGDLQFLRRYGAEMLLEIARFWSSAAHFNPERKRWEIHGVMGPDEYQEKYPGAEEGGVRNNAYTNVMAVWCVEAALEALDLVGETRSGELRAATGLDDEELERWRSLTRSMFVPFLEDGVIEQFEGYRDLEEFDWEGYRREYGDIQRLDRILKAEGDTPDRYKASKQADATMLFYLLSIDELSRIFSNLGYDFDADALVRTVEYYRRRSSHGSTLSWVVYASVVNLIDQDEGWRLFREALRSDIDDIQGGTTSEGIHLGAMAGTFDTVLRRFAGIRVTRKQVSFDPRCPPLLRGMRFRVAHRRQWIDVHLEPGALSLTLEATAPRPIPVRIRDQEAELEPGRSRRFELEG